MRLPTLAQAPQLAQALLAGGLRAFELTLTSPGALGAVERLRREIPALAEGRAVIGMGSVLNRAQAESAVAAGAQFIVAPTIDLPTIAYCTEHAIPVMPGALTPTEIQSAWAAGASFVKVFPARTFGPTYLKDLLAPLPHLKLMPTGGINLNNVADYIRHGAVVVGVGSNLVDRQLIAAENWEGLTARAKAYVSVVREARTS